MECYLKCKRVTLIPANLYCKHKQYTKQYKILSADNLKGKHYPTANKEWKNSVYNYNTRDTFNLPVKDNIVKRFIKSYLHLVVTPKLITKSHRMRTLLRRSSTKNLFISKPEIKQNNDKAIITIYLLNREKQLNVKNLFLIKNWLLRNNDKHLNTMFDVSNYTHYRQGYNNHIHSIYVKLLHKKHSRKYMVQKYLRRFDLEQYLSKFRYRKKRRIKRIQASSYRLRKNYYYNLLNTSLLKKKFILNSIFFFTFLKWALSVFRTKVVFIVPKNREGKRVVGERLTVMVKKGLHQKLLFRKHTIKISDLNIINVILLKYLATNLKRSFINPFNQQHNINLLYLQFKDSYYKKFMKKGLKKQILAINYLNKLFLSIFKYEKYLPLLKTFVKKIYNKKIEFNLVEHKYLHMNSDIFSEAISVKLRKKTSRVLRVLRKSKRLVKIPEIVIKDEQPTRNVSIYNRNWYLNKDLLYGLLKKMFMFKKSRKVAKFFWKTSINHILNTVKYKWTTGMRIEAKGRLTRRFTASRALYKYKYKGNLRNLDNLVGNPNITNKSEELNKSPKIYRLRGEFKPNVQHTFIYSNRRIGAFGVKGWISSN